MYLPEWADLEFRRPREALYARIGGLLGETFSTLQRCMLGDMQAVSLPWPGLERMRCYFGLHFTSLLSNFDIPEDPK